MSVQRKDIRNQVVSIIKRAKTRAGDNVVPNRQKPPWEERLPAISVRAEDETVTESTQAQKEFKRVLSLAIEVHDKSTDEAELSDRLDDIADQIEDALFADYTLNDKINELNVQSVNVDFEEEGGNVFAALKIIFQATYYEYRPSDRFNQKLNDFNTADVKYDLADGDDDVMQAEDNIDMT